MPEDRETNESLDSVNAHDPTMHLEVPNRLGVYRLTRMLGRGGMGEVWLAFDTKLERDVAIKVMRRELIAREDAVKRFYREARAVARLNHPNIVQVYAIGEEHDMIYMVMELVDGETVAQRLKRMGPLPLDEAVTLLLQAVEGLGYAHARGIIHRDVKPSNMMLTSDYRLKITDFGLAKIVEHDSQMTVAGTAIGSPNYMSPEQARGEEADHRSDIYALGISFYQMLTNELPFTGQTPLTVLLKQIQEELPEPECLRELAGGKALEVIKKMTAKRPDDRYQTYGGLSAALAALAPGVKVKPAAHAVTSTVPTPPELKKDKAETGTETPHEPTRPTELSVASTRLEAGEPSEPEKRHAPADAATRAVQAVPPATAVRDRSSTVVFAFAAIAIVALAVVGVVAVLKLQTVQPAVEVTAPMKSRAVRPEATVAPEPAPAGQVLEAVSPSRPPFPPSATTPASSEPSMATTAANSTPALPPTRSPFPSRPPMGQSPQASVPGGPALTLPAKVGPKISPARLRTIVLGAPDTVAGVTIPLYDETGQEALRLNAGTRITHDGIVRAGDETYYKIEWQGRHYRVRETDAHLDVDEIWGEPAGSPAKQGLRVRLGPPDAKAGQPIKIYPDSRSKYELTTLPAGTVLPAEDAGDGLGFYVQLRDGRKGYIFRKMAQPIK